VADTKIVFANPQVSFANDIPGQRVALALPADRWRLTKLMLLSCLEIFLVVVVREN
jgi:hypothetical protein